MLEIEQGILKEYQQFIQKNGTTLKVVPLENVIDRKQKKIIMYREHSATTSSSADLLRTKNARIWIGRIPPEIKEAWLMAAVIATMQENAKLIAVGRM